MFSEGRRTTRRKLLLTFQLLYGEKGTRSKPLSYHRYMAKFLNEHNLLSVMLKCLLCVTLDYCNQGCNRYMYSCIFCRVFLFKVRTENLKNITVYDRSNNHADLTEIFKING